MCLTRSTCCFGIGIRDPSSKTDGFGEVGLRSCLSCSRDSLVLLTRENSRYLLFYTRLRVRTKYEVVSRKESDIPLSNKGK